MNAEGPHILDARECAACAGACCEPERLEFPTTEGTDLAGAAPYLAEIIGLREAEVLGVRANEHGRTVIRTACMRRGRCDRETRPEACRRFPANYLNPDHSDAERAEVREFCALFRRLEAER